MRRERYARGGQDGIAQRPRFTVIEGGRPDGARPELAPPPAPRLGAEELAAEMAEIFALSLLRDKPLPGLDDPHAQVRIDRATTFTLHELLCELRNLPWCHAGNSRSIGAASVPSSRAGLGDSGHRRTLRLNGDGQLTLRTLFRSGVRLDGDSAVLSGFWSADHSVARPRPPETCPTADMPMSVWVHWCARHSGAGLTVPGQSVPGLPYGDLGAMAGALPHLPVGRPFHNAALAALARGAEIASGLRETGLWNGPRLFALMAGAERRARRLAVEQAGRLDRLTRPAVTAARMTVWLAREEREATPNAPEYREAAEILAESAPRLLDWVSRANLERRGRRRCGGTSLFLPLAAAPALHDNPADCVAHLVVAGALATLLKATLGADDPAGLPMIGPSAPSGALASEADRLVSNLALARVVTGGYYPAENARDIRLGQAIALHMLRDALEADNRSADLTFRDFDGQVVRVIAHPRCFGRGFAELRCNGRPEAWPQERAPAAAHLTQVV